MSKKRRIIQHPYGLRADLPKLEVAEIAFTTDDGKFHVGSSAGNVTMAREDHTHTPEDIGAAAASHTHTPADIGAAAASHSHAPEDIGAAPASHTHTLADVSESTDKKPSYLAAASSTDGVAYTATVDGITELYVGLTITIIPNLQSTSRTPTLNVNSLGAKRMVMPINGSNTSSTTQPPVVYNDDTTEEDLASKIAVAAKWLTANKPVTVRYDGTYWETDIVAQSATCLYGTVPIESGGTGANNAAAALNNLGLTATADELNFMSGIKGNVQEQIDYLKNQGSGSGSTTAGVSITDAEINADGELVIKYSDATQTNVGKVVGEPGAAGKGAYAYAQDGGYEGTEEEFGAKLAELLTLTAAEEASF